MNIFKSILGRRLGLTKYDELQAPGGFVAGGDGAPSLFAMPSPGNSVMFSDFMGDALPSEWKAGQADTGQTSTGITPLTNGVYRMTSSATSTQTPAGGNQCLSADLNFKANQGRLRFATRLKIATLAGNSVFAGFTDTAGNEMPAYDTGGGIQTPATDLVGFYCSGEQGTTEQAWRVVATKAGTDQTATTGKTPVANVYDALALDVSPDGALARFWINGTLVASIPSAAITPTVALSPTVARANTDAAADAVDIDYISASAARDTGT